MLYGNYENQIVMVIDGDYKGLEGTFIEEVDVSNDGIVCSILLEGEVLILPWDWFRFEDADVQEMWENEEMFQMQNVV